MALLAFSILVPPPASGPANMGPAPGPAGPFLTVGASSCFFSSAIFFYFSVITCEEVADAAPAPEAPPDLAPTTT